MICPNMKKNTLESVRNALLYDRYEINIEENVVEGARKALLKMLELS